MKFKLERSRARVDSDFVVALCHLNGKQKKSLIVLFQDGKISANEAFEYGNMTLAVFLEADKDQNGFVFPSEFDSDLVEFDSNLA